MSFRDMYLIRARKANITQNSSLKKACEKCHEKLKEMDSLLCQ